MNLTLERKRKKIDKVEQKKTLKSLKEIKSERQKPVLLAYFDCLKVGGDGE